MAKKNPQLNVTVPADAVERIDELAEAEALSRSSWLRRAVLSALRETEGATSAPAGR
jgi:hypothetical protein